MRFQSPKATKKAPPIQNRVANAAAAAVRTVHHIARGDQVGRSKADASRVLEVCKACPSDKFDERKQVCTHSRCGCFMKAKRWLHQEACPDGHFQ